MPGSTDADTDPFRVETDLVELAVLAAGDAVHEIRLNGSATRDAKGPFETRVARELREYCAGTRREFTFAVRAVGTPFFRAVWDQLERIPFGETRTYGEIAQALGQPGAARAVGSANHHNPVPLVIPCHRVVASDGTLGGFGGGVDLKRRLLELEGAITTRLI
jgi:methylated-DNA-[protein]-cysteine S-methyltransferase